MEIDIFLLKANYIILICLIVILIVANIAKKQNNRKQREFQFSI